jgi:outer membrane protein insertion porin family
VLHERSALSSVLLGTALLLSSIARAEPTTPPRSLDTWGLSETETPSEPAPPEEAEPEAPKDEPPAPKASSRETAPARREPCSDCTHGKPRDESSVRYTLEGLEVRGNTRTSSRVILRYIRFKAGDVLDVDDPEVQLTRFRLLGTGFFRDIQFSLRKGSERGRVVLVVDVVERNTIVVNDIAMGLAADSDARGLPGRLSAYAGLDVAETNLGGTGITLGGAAAVGSSGANVAPQIALRVRFLDPAFLGGPWMTSGVLLFNDAQDSFGYGRQKWNHPGGPEYADGPAIVRYKRFGGSLGIGRDLSISTQFWATYRLETVDANLPLAASQFRGFLEEPVDFHVVRGRSVLSTLSGTLQLDTRDHPFLPTRGWLVSFRGEVSLLPAALDYDYQKFELDAAHWWKLPFHDHVLKVGVFAGGISGHAPFFEQFYVGDYTDLLPDRVLGMNFDRRPAPNFLGTDIVEVRYGDYALKLSAEYRIPLYRGRRSIYGIDLFATGGLYGVAGRRDLTEPPSGYSGLARIPLDITGNIGLRMDTSAGGFAFAFSNVLSFVPVRGEGPAGR